MDPMMSALNSRWTGSSLVNNLIDKGHQPLELEILGLIDDAHAPGPDLLDDPVLACDNRTRLQDANRGISGS